MLHEEVGDEQMSGQTSQDGPSTSGYRLLTARMSLDSATGHIRRLDLEADNEILLRSRLEKRLLEAREMLETLSERVKAREGASSA